jgi:hypothetical protein
MIEEKAVKENFNQEIPNSNLQEETLIKDEKFKIEGSELENSLMKHGTCSCGRKGMLYKEKCYFCFLEETKKIAQELQGMIRDEGRSNLMSVDKIRITRDKLLELI